ncbi:hypothetical protein F5Y12DRAFT_776837 [Xylaria sp. FL1777]|nr:hypothetical protein F5Y12DRAFT_776837 [Xylaria sp. FL1777]
MAARIVSTGARSVFAASTPSMTVRAAARSFHATSRNLADATAALPTRKPVGAFRGGLFGFLLGTTLAGGGVYGYTLSVQPFSPAYSAAQSFLPQILQTGRSRVEAHYSAIRAVYHH